MDWNAIQQIVRIGAQWGAGALVTAGWIGADMTSMFVGAAVSVAALVWWVVWERGRDAPKVPEID